MLLATGWSLGTGKRHLWHSSASELLPDDSCWTAPDSYRAPCHAAVRLAVASDTCTAFLGAP